MDANGGIPGHEIGSPNDRWLADLMAIGGDAAGRYRRAGKPQPTHFSLQGYSKEGTAGWRAAVHHAVVVQPKRAVATAHMLQDAWVALLPAHWRLHTSPDGQLVPPGVTVADTAPAPARRVTQSAGGVPRSIAVPLAEAQWPVVDRPRTEGAPSWRSFAMANQPPGAAAARGPYGAAGVCAKSGANDSAPWPATCRRGVPHEGRAAPRSRAMARGWPLGHAPRQKCERIGHPPCAPR